jgi:hypothetical protein
VEYNDDDGGDEEQMEEKKTKKKNEKGNKRKLLVNQLFFFKTVTYDFASLQKQNTFIRAARSAKRNTNSKTVGSI